MKLRHLLALVPSLATSIPDHHALEQNVTGLSTNSHTCQPGYLFLGMPGTKVDGGQFWSEAIQSGAIAAIVTMDAATLPNPNHACLIPCKEMVPTCAHIAAAFYEYPARQLTLVGVTGTNGKTTTTHLIEHLLQCVHKPTGLLGTLYARWPGYEHTSIHTTPFAIQLQAQLASAVAAGCEFCIMEVSSHALAQSRVLGCEFAVSVFTNLTQDHLDYHGTMENYYAAKSLLFSPDYLKGSAVINIDDNYGVQLVHQLGLTKAANSLLTYSVHNPQADVYTHQLVYGITGVKGRLTTPSTEVDFFSPLMGEYNLSNVLAAIATGIHLGLDLGTMITHLSSFPGVPGRMERIVTSPSQDISVIVDYAHTPDSLENLLRAARPFIPGQMICVFGCGGDRDRTKRPLMGTIAAQLADQVIITSDNPRTEDPNSILTDIRTGIPPLTLQSVQVIPDRAAAIHTAIVNAKPGDGILIAGKGHEDYQILGIEKIHFDDREQARAALSMVKRF